MGMSFCGGAINRETEGNNILTRYALLFISQLEPFFGQNIRIPDSNAY